jgi:hypothetical protein
LVPGLRQRQDWPGPAAVTAQPQTVALVVWATQLQATKQTALLVSHLLPPVLLVMAAKPAVYLVLVAVRAAVLQLPMQHLPAVLAAHFQAALPRLAATRT